MLVHFVAIYVKRIIKRDESSGEKNEEKSLI